MDELKKLAALRKGAGSKEQFQKIIAFTNALTREDAQMMRKVMAMYDKAGV